MKTSYILVDFENVQPDSIGSLDAAAFSIIFLVGAKQLNMKIDVVQALNQSGVPYVIERIEGNGKNALDFHIAYYIGRLSTKSPDSVFHIISKDTGFDPLIRHLEKEKIVCQRWSAITEIHSPRVSHPKTTPPPREPSKRQAKAAAKQKPKASSHADEMMKNLEKRPSARPTSLKALSGVIKSHFRAISLTSTEIEAIIEELKKRNFIAVDVEKVTYPTA